MVDKQYNILGMGNAIVDLLAHIDDDFLTQHKLQKGIMSILESHEIDRLHKGVKVVDFAPGGSAANTIAGTATLGLNSAFIGKINNDSYGDAFETGLKKCGVNCHATKIDGELSTARSLILVTPDAQRTMNTYLGVAGHLEPADVDEAVVRESEIVYFEGYLWDKEGAKNAFHKAIGIARDCGGKTALSLSDPFCVDRHRSAFLDLARNHIDVLFANEEEIKSLFETEYLDEAIGECRKFGITVAITLAENGSLIVDNNGIYNVPAEPVDEVVDTTGAGDLFAAGFLSGVVKNKSAAICGKMGSIAAAEIISHFGARPKQPLLQLMSQKGIEV
jgi:sugar/nucleoside kinase (ribokinase family)